MKLSGLSGLLQFILGFLLGIALLLGGAATLGYFLLSNLIGSPPKPLFAEEKKALTPKQEPNPPASSVSVPSPTPTPVASSTPSPELPKGTYKAKVIWNGGLSLRADASAESARLGGVPYKAEIIVLETNGDNTWQRIRLLTTGQEGWIKAGNIEKID